VVFKKKNLILSKQSEDTANKIFLGKNGKIGKKLKS
jgi:hypothetical protein